MEETKDMGNISSADSVGGKSGYWRKICCYGGISVLSTFITVACIGFVINTYPDDFAMMMLRLKVITSENVDNAKPTLLSEECKREYVKLQNIVTKSTDEIKVLLSSSKKELVNSENQFNLALAKAKDKKNNNALRSMYYINAITLNPGSTKTLKEYISFMISTVEKESRERQLETYQSLITFLGSLSAKVPCQTIPVIEELSSTLRNKVNGLVLLFEKESTQVEGKGKVDIVTVIEEANAVWNTISKQIRVDSIDSVDNSISSINNYLSTYSGLSNKKGFKQTYDNAKNRIEELTIIRQVLVSIDRCEQMVVNVQKDVNVEHALVCAASLENSLNNLISVKYQVPETVSRKIDQLEDKLLILGKSLKERNNRPILEAVDSKIKNAIKTNNNSYESLIQGFTELIKDVQRSKLDSNTKVDIIELISKKVASLRRDQSKCYNEWALKVIKKAFDKVKDGVGKFRDDDKKTTEGLVMIAEIDIGYLSPSIHSAYQTVFQYGYSTLDDDNKIEADEKMEKTAKKQLGEF